MTLSCPGDAYFVYESCPMGDQTKLTCFYFRLIKLEPEILSRQNRKRCSRVLYPKRSKRSKQLATSSSIAIAFEELNDGGSHTTVFCAWNNVSTFLHYQTTHRQSIWEARIKMILIYHALYISEAGSVRVSQWLQSWLSARLSVATERTRSGHG